MNAFLIPGGLSHLSRITNYLSDDVCGILVHQRTDPRAVELPESASRNLAGNIFTLSSLLEMTAAKLEEGDRVAYAEWLDYILSDARVHYLAARVHLNSAFNNAAMIEKILLNSILIIRKTSPSCLISSSTPHSLEAWIFAKCFEYLELPIYIVDSTPIAFRSWIYKGLDTQEVVLQQQEDRDSKQLTVSSWKLYKEQRESKPGDKSEDGFRVSRIYLNSIAGAESNRWWSYKRELSWLFSGKLLTLPLRLLSTYLKSHLYRTYCDVAIQDLPRTPFIVFFLHYQPERSSLPIGLSYVQQWIAIRLLSWSLPEGWTLLVREHPSTWLKPLDISVRTKALYRDISSLENTRLCSMEADTFELIDRCKAVATLTGNVGFQAILRSKPVIAFGLASYKDHPACFSVSSYKDLVGALNAIEGDGLGVHFEDSAITDYLLWIERNSFSADPEESDWIEARLKNFTEIYKQLLCGDLDLATAPRGGWIAKAERSQDHL